MMSVGHDDRNDVIGINTNEKKNNLPHTHTQIYDIFSLLLPSSSSYGNDDDDPHHHHHRVFFHFQVKKSQSFVSFFVVANIFYSNIATIL